MREEIGHENGVKSFERYNRDQQEQQHKKYELVALLSCIHVYWVPTSNGKK